MNIINTKQTNNTTIKYVTREKLDLLIKEAQASGDWSKVEDANVSEITDMSELFKNIKGIKDLDLSKWDTSNVTNMSYMFSKSDFNNKLTLDTSNVKNMSFMFSNSSFNQQLDLDTSNVKDMSCMFMSSKYNYPLNFDTSNVKDMSCMFMNSKYNQPLHFDTSKVKNMDAMFKKSEYNQPLPFDVSNVKCMYFIFGESKFTGDISDWNIKETYENRSAIKYRDECLKKRVEKEAIEYNIENNKSTLSSRVFKL